MPMRFFCLWLALCASSCTTSNEPNKELLDRIEAEVVLPSAAEPMHQYSRYYAPGDEGRIEALYVMHDQYAVQDTREYCRRSGENTFPCSNGKSQLTAAGTRTWLTDPRDLPGMHGGGCGQIRFSYQPHTGQFSVLRCNWEY